MEPVWACRVEHEPVFGSAKSTPAFLLVFLLPSGRSSSSSSLCGDATCANSYSSTNIPQLAFRHRGRRGEGPTHLILEKRVLGCGLSESAGRSDCQRVKPHHFSPIPQSKTAQNGPQICPHAWSALSVIVQHFPRIPPTRTQQQPEPPWERQTEPLDNSVFFSENPSLSWANGASDGLCQNVRRGLVMFADLRGQTPPLVSLRVYCRRLRRCAPQSLHAHWRKVRLPTCRGRWCWEKTSHDTWFHNHAAPRGPDTRTPICAAGMTMVSGN